MVGAIPTELGELVALTELCAPLRISADPTSTPPRSAPTHSTARTALRLTRAPVPIRSDFFDNNLIGTMPTELGELGALTKLWVPHRASRPHGDPPSHPTSLPHGPHPAHSLPPRARKLRSASL